jgi:(1->4)-alpha-D-glucan 1-alpha-D-glucosylmutase
MAVRPAATATYRLQLHAGMGLAAARALVPYLDALGVSHLYTSPLLQARRESRHGYDVVDPTRLDPKLGTSADLAALARRLHRRGMGMLVDLVPNHMAVGPENRFWDDVLAHGEASPYARWYDVAWRRPDGRPVPVRIPVLGDLRTRLVARGELRVVVQEDRVRLRYGDGSYPLDPKTLAPLVARAARALGPGRVAGELDDVATALDALAPRDAGTAAHDRATRAGTVLERLAALLRRDSTVLEALERTLATLAGPALSRFLDHQAYRLVHWRRAAGDVNYRRFFAVSELVGLRAEDPAVFAATHARVLAWAAAGLVDWVRVDHVDGLADPLGYLRRLRAALDDAGASDAPVLIEKILTGDEQVRAGWPVAGTTGYEFLNALDAVFVEPRGLAALIAWYRRTCTGRRRVPGFRAVAWTGKQDMADSWLAPDVRRLVELLPDDPARRPARRRRALRDAVVELLVCFPVYRSYVDGRPGSPARADRAAVLRALRDARRRGRAEPAALRAIAGVLLAPGRLGGRTPFVRRFQQISGALMAKGVEDTALYRWVPLAARNEVGGDPSLPTTDAVARLHTHLMTRARRFPQALSATTTHDTKRSADARARLATLAEIPERWTACVARWRTRHRPWRRRIDGRLAPDPVTEYLFYQSVVAVWPLAGHATDLGAVGDRVRAYVHKAAREAGLHTSWLTPATDWEDAVDAFGAAVLAAPGFRAEVTALVATVGRAGLWTALARTLVHLTAPGVPDLYQGDELWCFTLTDPDNRGDVDFARREALLATLAATPVDPALARTLVDHPEDGRPKLHTIRAALALRRRAAAVFRGAYVPLDRGQPALRHAFAFARTAGGRAVVTIVPRFALSLMRGESGAPVGPRVWRDTALRLPASLARRRFTNVLTGEMVVPARGTLRLADAFATFPVALFWSEG